MPTSYRCNLHPHGKTKDGIPINTKLHFDYIYREGKYKNIRNHGEDLRHKSSGNIPAWANEDPAKFWQAAEDNRQKQNYHGRQEARAYREFELTLQMDLSLDDNIHCVEKFLEQTGIAKSHAYSYAIHERPARNDKDMVNIHAHVMFDEHIIEKDRPLNSAEEFFKRYSKDKNGNVVGGYKKDRRLHDRPFLIDARKKWEVILNEKLKENGIDEEVSCETLQNQKEKMYSKGENQIADMMNREPAPKMAGLLRNPNIQKEIDKKISDFDAGLIETKPIEEMDYVERNVTLYAKDAVLRRAARRVQQERKQQIKRFLKAKTEEEAKSIRESPVVITVGDMKEYFSKKAEDIFEQIQREEEKYNQERKSILNKKWYNAEALQRMTNGQYQKKRKAAQEAKRIYDEANAKDESMLDRSYPNWQERYFQYNMDKVKKRTIAEEKQKELTNLINECQVGRKEEYEATLKAIEKENEQKSANAKKSYGKIKILEKEEEACHEILKDFDKADPETILFSEPIPKQLTRNDRVDGTIPVKKFQACGYKGNIYYIIEGENEQVKGIRIGDDIIEGQVPVYQIERKKEDNRYHITRVTPTEEKQRMYRGRNQKDKPEYEKYKPEQNPTIQKADQEQQQRANGILHDTAESLFGNKTKVIRLRWQEKDEHKLNAMEEAEKKLYEGWHPIFPPRTL